MTTCKLSCYIECYVEVDFAKKATSFYVFFYLYTNWILFTDLDTVMPLKGQQKHTSKRVI